jgi:FAD/FMN-containing dehydrogenase
VAAGLILGGGFGSFSKAYGLAAASLLEAEIVTADGATRSVNEVREPDLFWALKGGRGGTFGVVTHLTLATHPLPDRFGAVNLTLRARSDEAFHRLIARFRRPLIDFANANPADYEGQQSILVSVSTPNQIARSLQLLSRVSQATGAACRLPRRRWGRSIPIWAGR